VVGRRVELDEMRIDDDLRRQDQRGDHDDQQDQQVVREAQEAVSDHARSSSQLTDGERSCGSRTRPVHDSGPGGEAC
jgi:hypothetical protein